MGESKFKQITPVAVGDGEEAGCYNATTAISPGRKEESKDDRPGRFIYSVSIYVCMFEVS